MLGRRHFLRLIGVAAPGSALAAKHAIDTEIANVAGIGMTGLGNHSVGAFSGGAPAGASQSLGPFVSYEQRLTGAADYMRTFGIPEWFEFQLRDAARYVSSLDPDIACKRAWSMSVKINEQRQRNYARGLERVHKSGWINRGRGMIQKLLGFEWPH